MTNETTRTKHVLVVDDDPDFAALLRSILKQAEYTVATSYFCDQALAQVRDLKPDLITLDMGMPSKSGAFFYRKLKADETLRDIPVVVVTGLTRNDKEMENIVRCLLETDNVPPPDAYLEKPVDGPDLIRTIEEVLSSRTCGNC